MIGRLAVLLAAVLPLACAPPEKAPPPPAPVAPEAPPAAPTPPAAPITLPADGRVIVEAREYPWSAVGRLNTGGRGFCTGVLIGPRHVLASAPCLFNAVEGRWWHPSEVHFLAGYQRDVFLADSQAAAYRVAPAFRPGAGLSLANVAENWALVTLERPVGKEAGWLGLGPLDPDLRGRLAAGEALRVPVGYRRGAEHAVTVNLGCGPNALTPGPEGGVDCEVLPDDVAVPPLVFDGASFRLASAQLAGDTGGPARSLARALGAAGLTGAEGRPPAGGRAAAVPRATVDLFLIYLGYLRPAARDVLRAPGAAERRAAIRAFQASRGLPVDGRASLRLLGHLLWAAQPAPRVGARPPAGDASALRLARLSAPPPP